ncbi:hypothetical protein HMPREF1552_00584 [Leptotrichia sp. oral taxon 879 str. F0557]|nr:hypothetical protein HMPREF1552_00584 [Leptotrichia sp. oral taxon 879 str. F0557]
MNFYFLLSTNPLFITKIIYIILISKIFLKISQKIKGKKKKYHV